MADTPHFLNEPFSITDEHLNTGLRGFPVGTVRTSDVDPMEGVSYVGFPIEDLADLPCENVIYLLFHNHKHLLPFNTWHTGCCESDHELSMATVSFFTPDVPRSACRSLRCRR